VAVTAQQQLDATGQLAFGELADAAMHRPLELPDLSTKNPLKLTAAVQFALFLAARYCWPDDSWPTGSVIS
jgi:hypothetical protein